MDPTPCQRHEDPDMWFSVSPYKIAAAVKICGTCPIRDACAAEAINSPEREFGVWGGLTEEELRRISRATRASRLRGAAA